MEDNIRNILAQEDTKKGLVQTFFDSLKKMFTSMKKDKDIDVDELVVSQGESEEEKEILKEICEDIHSFNSNFRELHEAKIEDPTMTDTKWLEQHMDSDADALAQAIENRDATSAEKAQIKKEFTKSMDEQIELESNMLNKEISTFASSLVEPENDKEKKK